MKMNIPLTKPTIKNAASISEDAKFILQSGQLTNGPFTTLLENQVAEITKSSNVIAVNSCTSGLMLVWRNLLNQLDVPSGKSVRVLMSAFTFGATLTSLLWLRDSGIDPVLVDVDPITGEIDLVAAEDALEEYTVAICVMDVFGRPCDYEAIRKFAQRHGLFLIADSAQAMGSRAHVHGNVGHQADYHVFSMSPSKVFTAGEGGVITVNGSCGRETENIRRMRDYGKTGDGSVDMNLLGLSARMSEMNAAVGSSQLMTWKATVRTRIASATWYDGAVERHQLEKIGVHTVPWHIGERVGNISYYVLHIDPIVYCVATIAKRLSEAGIQTKRYFNPILPGLTLAQDMQVLNNGECEEAIWLGEGCLAIPMWTGISPVQQEYVMENIHRILKAEAPNKP